MSPISPSAPNGESDISYDNFDEQEAAVLSRRWRIFAPVTAVLVFLSEALAYVTPEFPKSPGLVAFMMAFLGGMYVLARSEPERHIIGWATVAAGILGGGFAAVPSAQTDHFMSPHVLSLPVVFALVPGILSLKRSEAFVLLAGGLTAWLLVNLHYPDEAFSHRGLTTVLIYFFFLALVTLLSVGHNRDLREAEFMARQRLSAANREVNHINEVAHLVNSTLNLDDVMNSVIDSLHAIFHFDLVGIALIDESSNRLVFGPTYGELSADQIERWDQYRIPLQDTDSWFIKAATQRKMHYIADLDRAGISRFDAHDRALNEISPIRGRLICPLEVQGKSIGIIMFGNTKGSLHLDSNDIARVQRYITQITTAINNARIYKDLWDLKATTEQQAIDLEHSRKLIRRYVPASVAESIIAGDYEAVDRPQRRLVTVLFSDIVGFTEMADRMDPEAVTAMINQYMSEMSQIVERNSGTLNEFAGDGLMSLFGAPFAMQPADQVTHALNAAIEMQQRIPSLNDQWSQLGIGSDVAIRIGINTGYLSVGSFGSEGRMTYTAIGLHTNIADRIQSHCEPGGILMSEDSWEFLKGLVDGELRGEIHCKGVQVPVKVYAPKFAL